MHDQRALLTAGTALFVLGAASGVGFAAALAASMITGAYGPSPLWWAWLLVTLTLIVVGVVISAYERVMFRLASMQAHAAMREPTAPQPLQRVYVSTAAHQSASSRRSRRRRPAARPNAAGQIAGLRAQMERSERERDELLASVHDVLRVQARLSDEGP